MRAVANESKKKVKKTISASPTKKKRKVDSQKKQAAKSNKNKSANQLQSKKRNTTKTRTKYRKVPPSKVKKVLQFAWDILFYLFLFLIIGGAVFFNFNDSPDKSFFGYRFMTVLTNSMAPNPEKPELTDGFTSGAIIIIQQVNPETLKEGDIITFYPVEGNTESYLTHRIVKTMDELDGEEGFFIQTQGDANTGADIPIRSNQVVGKVIFKIPLIGNFLNFVRDNLVIVAFFVATLFGLFMTLKYYIGVSTYQKVQPTRKRKKIKHS